MNVIASWVSFKSRNYIDGAEMAELSGAEAKQQWDDTEETRSLESPRCHSKEQDLRPMTRNGVSKLFILKSYPVGLELRWSRVSPGWEALR